MASSSHLDPRAEELFLEYLARRDAGEVVDFDALCAAEPRHAEQLRALRAAHEIVVMLRPSQDSEPLARRLRRRYGDAADLSLSLDGGAEQVPLAAGQRVPSGTTADSELLARLHSSGPRGTRYRLLGEVARGGMGAVLRIWDDELRRTLAMKVVLGKGESATGETPAVDPKTLGRFLEEAQITGQLDHPGIVPVHELGLDAAGRVYFTMKLVKGEDLRAVFGHVEHGRDGWSQIRALNVLLRVCEALAFAHAKGVVHRDLKPANVMVGRFGEVYVMDWGLARVIGRADKHDLRLRPESSPPVAWVDTDRRREREATPGSPLITMDGDVMGTPSYMAPEQARGEIERLGPHSDVYAVGAMLYQLVTGRTPFVPDDARVSPYAILMRVLAGPPKPVHELAPETPAELVAIVEKAMAREIADRYPTTLALAEDLRAFVEGRVVHAYESGAWAEARKWVQRNKPLAASLAAAVLAIALGGASFAWKAKQATEARDELAARNAELAATNAALDRSRGEAVANAARAEQGEQAARDNESRALRGEAAAQLARDEATQRANDVLSLSAQKDLDDLIGEAEKLWPAHPETIPAYEAWLARARELIDGRPADEAKGLQRRPGLTEHQAKLAELRARALPRTEAQAQAERAAHPRYAELEAKRAELGWRSRMLGLEPWPDEAQVETQLAQESLPADARALNALARPLVDLAQPVYGEEVRALLLAYRAVAASSDAQRAGIRDTLAWALLRVNRLEEALAESAAALEEAGGQQLKGSAARLEKAVSAWRGEGSSQQAAAREALANEVGELSAAVDERREYEYEDPESTWWERQLSRLVSDLESFRDPSTGLMGNTLAEPFGWGVAKRYEFARTIADRSIEGPEAQRSWSEAIAAIRASPRYGGLELTPQIGLSPIGIDPDSGLWEFAHLQTGDPPVRGADGRLVLTEETGLVFVLIPGGTFWMGAQRSDPNGRNYDPQANANEAPVHEVELSAYFLSKYEMTQGQWERIAARNPSLYKPPSGLAPSLLHPVEQVSWDQCRLMLESLDLALPSEAQWENGARAGTSSPWWTGAERESLRGKANLADQSAKRGGAPWPAINDWPDLEDGAMVHAQVGRYAANAFGLHEVHGNEWEWCLDGWGDYASGSVKDPLPPWLGSAFPVARGGGFDTVASHARSSSRNASTPGGRNSGIGLRPSRALRLANSPLHPSPK